MHAENVVHLICQKTTRNCFSRQNKVCKKKIKKVIAYKIGRLIITV